jgi:hypothetical protein
VKESDESRVAEDVGRSHGTFGNFAHHIAAPPNSLNDNGGEKTAERLRGRSRGHGVHVRRQRGPRAMRRSSGAGAAVAINDGPTPP